MRGGIFCCVVGVASFAIPVAATAITDNASRSKQRPHHANMTMLVLRAKIPLSVAKGLVPSPLVPDREAARGTPHVDARNQRLVDLRIATFTPSRDHDTAVSPLSMALVGIPARLENSGTPRELLHKTGMNAVYAHQLRLRGAPGLWGEGPPSHQTKRKAEITISGNRGEVHLPGEPTLRIGMALQPQGKPVVAAREKLHEWGVFNLFFLQQNATGTLHKLWRLPLLPGGDQRVAEAPHGQHYFEVEGLPPDSVKVLSAAIVSGPTQIHPPALHYDFRPSE